MRRFFIGFIVGFIILGIGIPITAVEFLSYNYNEKEYFENVDYEEKTYTYDIEGKNINIYNIYGYRLHREDFVKVIEDSSIDDEIKLVITYPYELTDLYVNAVNSDDKMNVYVNYEYKHNIRFDSIRKIITSVINDLKKNNIYSYKKTMEPKITLYVSSDNISKINM